MSVQLQSKYSGNQPFHVYYDMDLINNNNTVAAIPTAFRYTEVRNQPFLGSPENYFLTVARFQVQTPTLPVFIPQILLGQSDTNKTAYSITLTWTSALGNVYTNIVTGGTQTYVTYVSYDTTQVQPVAVGGSLSIADITNPYYYMYSITQWVNLINAAFVTAFAQLQTYINAGTYTSGAGASVVGVPVAADIAQWNAQAGVVLPAQNAHAPFMEWDPVTLTATINGDVALYSTSLTGGAVSAVPSPVKIYFNSALYALYNNFQFVSYGFTAPTFGRNFQLIMYNNQTNLYNVPVAVPYNAIQVYQEGQTAALLNPVSSLVFTTSLLPIVQSNIGTPFLISTSGITGSSGLANIAPVITDFIVPYSALNTYKPDVSYTPNSEYRLVDLYGTSPLSAIEVSVFWKDFYGQNHPLLLGAGSSASIKLLFRRKDFYNASLFRSI